jgi:hypothetical protein
MHDFEKSIAEWRRQMLAAGIQTPVPLEELESHLREEIGRLVKSGLDEQDVFTSAVQKLGPAHAVQTEFMKAAQIQGAFKGRLADIGLTLVTILVPLLFGGIVLKRAGFIDMTAAEELSSLTALAAFSLLAWSGRLSHRLLPVIQNKRIRDAILASCGVPLILWWVVFFRLILPRLEFTMGEVLVAFCWAFVTPAGAYLGLNWGIETAARKKSCAGAPVNGKEQYV